MEHSPIWGHAQIKSGSSLEPLLMPPMTAKGRNSSQTWLQVQHLLTLAFSAPDFLQAKISFSEAYTTMCQIYD